MKDHPGGAGCDDDPRRRVKIAAGVTGLCSSGLSSYPSSPAVRKVLSADARRLECASEVVKRPFCRSFGDVTGSSSEVSERVTQHTDTSSEVTDSSQRPAGVASEAAETLRSVRSGGPGPNGEAAVTGDRREPNERRCGGGAESGGWREVAEWCHATEGSGHE